MNRDTIRGLLIKLRGESADYCLRIYEAWLYEDNLDLKFELEELKDRLESIKKEAGDVLDAFFKEK